MTSTTPEPNDRPSDKYEELFSCRYTDEDPDYVAAQKTQPPMCLYPWSSKPKRSFDYSAVRRKRRFEEIDRGHQYSGYSFINDKRPKMTCQGSSREAPNECGFRRGDGDSQPKTDRIFYPRQR
ncbi:unnamed protein product [Soboliphyme baturini]|uniref:Uncharacterized protein n=1 Tax=Soboliphyme baturini TaxID=241478 RepID=A0A183ITJ0_9BILA|nr:unnamed protein product [Soboliphyme baturini]